MKGMAIDDFFDEGSEVLQKILAAVSKIDSPHHASINLRTSQAPGFSHEVYVFRPGWFGLEHDVTLIDRYFGYDQACSTYRKGKNHIEQLRTQSSNP